MSAGLAAVTATPGSTPPDSSRTCPTMELWAHASVGVSIRTAAMTSDGRDLAHIELSVGHGEQCRIGMCRGRYCLDWTASIPLRQYSSRGDLVLARDYLDASPKAAISLRSTTCCLDDDESA